MFGKLLSADSVVSAACGYRTNAEVDTNLSWSTLSLPPALWEELKAGALIPLHAPTGTIASL
jgi:hypothetical protein